MNVSLIAKVVLLEEKTSKSGNPYGILRLREGTQTWKFTIFSNQLNRLAQMPTGGLFIVTGKTEQQEYEGSMRTQNVITTIDAIAADGGTVAVEWAAKK